MVLEGLVEEAALSASESAVHDHPTVQLEPAEGAEGGIGGVVSKCWADIFEEPPAPTTGVIGPAALEEAGVESREFGEFITAGGAAFGAPGEEASDTEGLQPRFDALSLLE